MPEQKDLVERNPELPAFPDRRSFFRGQKFGWRRAIKITVRGDEPRNGGFKAGDMRGCLERNGFEDAAHLILQTHRT
jgi:hypothetical protein